MLRKIILFFVVSLLFTACKKVDIETPMSVQFRPLPSDNLVGVQDTAYVDIAGNGVVKFVANNSYNISIDQEGPDYVVFTQKSKSAYDYIIAGLVSQGQVKGKDTLYLNGKNSPSSLSNMFYYSTNSGYVNSMNTYTYAYDPIYYSGGTPQYLSKSGDGKSFMINLSSGGFNIIAVTNGSLVSTNSNLGVSSAFKNSRFTYDGKSIYGSLGAGGYYVKDYVTKTVQTLPISATNSNVINLFIGKTSPSFDYIAYVEKSGSFYYLKYYKGGVVTTIASINMAYGNFGDIAVSRDGRYVAYDLFDRGSGGSSYGSNYVRLYDASTTGLYTIDYSYYTTYTQYKTAPAFNSNNQIAYTMYFGKNYYYSSAQELMIYSINSGTSVNLREEANISSAFYPCW